MTTGACFFAPFLAFAAAVASTGTTRGVPMKNTPQEEVTCGEEMAASAEVPRRWMELMNHVATNMEWHAKWVGVGSSTAQAEHDALLRVAKEYRAMAAAAGGAALAMAAMKNLAPAMHDPSKVDRAAQARWMRTKIHRQREFADMLLRHAEDSEKALAELERRGSK